MKPRWHLRSDPKSGRAQTQGVTPTSLCAHLPPPARAASPFQTSALFPTPSFGHTPRRATSPPGRDDTGAATGWKKWLSTCLLRGGGPWSRTGRRTNPARTRWTRSFSRAFAVECPARDGRRKVYARLRDPNHLRGRSSLSTFHGSTALPKRRRGEVPLVLEAGMQLRGTFYSTEGARRVLLAPEHVWEGKFGRCTLNVANTATPAFFHTSPAVGHLSFHKCWKCIQFQNSFCLNWWIYSYLPSSEWFCF